MTSETRSPVDGAPDECRTAASDRGLREARVAIGSSDFDAIGIDGLVSLWSEAGLRDFEAISYHGNGAVVQVAVERPLDPLAERQREVLRTAYEMGHYDVPRGVSSADLAAELDVDASTVAEHLQRAERNLLTRQLSPQW